MSRSADEPNKSGKGAELAEQAISAEVAHADIEAQIKNLGPEEAAMFARLLEHNLRKRRWMLGGYLAALFAVLGGLTWALWYSGSHPNTFIGWVFIVPPGLAAVIIWAVGARVKRLEP
jgi:peptidoglycan/LPS O-acetylase OafA/YrhL